MRDTEEGKSSGSVGMLRRFSRGLLSRPIARPSLVCENRDCGEGAVFSLDEQMRLCYTSLRRPLTATWRLFPLRPSDLGSRVSGLGSPVVGSVCWTDLWK